jgi:hypothetical protein
VHSCWILLFILHELYSGRSELPFGKRNYSVLPIYSRIEAQKKVKFYKRNIKTTKKSFEIKITNYRVILTIDTTSAARGNLSFRGGPFERPDQRTTSSSSPPLARMTSKLPRFAFPSGFNPTSTPAPKLPRNASRSATALRLKTDQEVQ